MQEFVRLVKSARVTMADRSVALALLQAARGEVEGRRAKLMKLRGTPGIRVRRWCMSSYTQPTDFMRSLGGGFTYRGLSVFPMVHGTYGICCIL